MTPIERNETRTRRWFLLRGIAAPAMIMAAEACVRVARRSEVLSTPLYGLDEHEFSVLRRVVDEIIPASDGMPAASEVGSLEYLAQLAHDHADVRADLEKALATLATVSRDVLATPFTGLSQPLRTQALLAMEKRAPREFATLKDYTYEAYYTRSQILLLIGYDRNSTQEERWNDDALLAPVRAMPRLYRPVT